jgi:hypothetical protein
VAKAASRTPATSFGGVVPALRPAAGTCPPRPGSRRIANATMIPATAVTGSGHHSGAVAKPSQSGTSWKTPTWIWWISSRKAHAASDATTPTTAAQARSTTKRRLAMVAAGSASGAGGSAM